MKCIGRVVQICGHRLILEPGATLERVKSDDRLYLSPWLGSGERLRIGSLSVETVADHEIGCVENVASSVNAACVGDYVLMEEVARSSDMLTYTGQLALYFNRHQDAPRVWCIAPHDRAWELQVPRMRCETPCVSVYKPSGHVAHVDPHDGPPSAYFSTYGTLTVDEGGTAIIR